MRHKYLQYFQSWKVSESIFMKFMDSIIRKISFEEMENKHSFELNKSNSSDL